MHNHSTRQKETGEYPGIILVGNPNVGKSVIFGYLTGRYVAVSNYPGTTIEVSRGKTAVNGETYSVIDTPGINSLLPMSEDEEVTRNILLNEPQAKIVQVGDSRNLKRTLLISLQLAEMGLPFTLNLNLHDEAVSRGITIDTEMLSTMLDVDVLSTVAIKKTGLDKLSRKMVKPRTSTFKMRYDKNIEVAISELVLLLPKSNISKRSIALMLLAGDTSLMSWLHDHLTEKTINKIDEIRLRINALYQEPLGYVINKKRLIEVEKLVSKVLTLSTFKKEGLGASLGNWMMHPLWGIPVLLVVLYVMYYFVGVFGAGTLVDFLETSVFERYISPWATHFFEAFIPFTFLQDFFVGEFGLVTMALSYSIAIVLPIVGTFFISFSILEDSGYLPRLAVMVNKVLRLMGLSGKAVLPMVLGLGCATMATMSARILESKKDKIIVTLLLALGIPCSAQLGVILGILGSVSLGILMIWLGVIVGVLFIVGFLSSMVIPGESSDFLYELPPIRLPQFKNILYKTVARINWYLREAVPLFILGTLILFVLDKLKLLKVIEQAASPVVVNLLGLPEKATEAFLIGFLRRDYGAAGLYDLQKDGLMDPIQTLVSLVTMTLFIPCIANLFMIIKERGLQTAIWMLVFILPFAIFVGGTLNFLLRSFGAQL